MAADNHLFQVIRGQEQNIQELEKQAKQILDTAESQKRELTSHELAKLEHLSQRAEAIKDGKASTAEMSKVEKSTLTVLELPMLRRTVMVTLEAFSITL